MKRQRLLELRAILVVAVVSSLAYNSFVPSPTSFLFNFYATDDTYDKTTPVLPLVAPKADTGTRNKRPPRNQLLLGIPCSEEMQSAILETYLNQTSPHAFHDACPLFSNHGSNMNNCSVMYQLLKEETPMIVWWNHVRQSLKAVFAEEEEAGNPLILWVTGRTILYPPYFRQFLAQSLPDNGTQKLSSIFGETPKVDCSRRPRKPDKMACQKLLGEVVLISYQALQQLRSSLCSDSNINSKTDESNSTWCWRQFLLKNSSSSITRVVDIPPQYQRPTAFAFRRFWNKLIDWNELPVNTVEFVTAKFGRQSKFANEIEWSKTGLNSFGHSRAHIHGYFDFPPFLLQDDIWKLHLAFLHDTSLKPKGAGYWFWKAPLLLHHLQRIGFGDFLVYADADLRDHCSWLIDLIREMIQSKKNVSLALYQVEYADRIKTKRDVYDYYCHNKDPSTDFSRMYAAGWLVLKKTPGTIEFIKQWQQGMSNYSMLNDSPSHLPNIPDFEYHLHDQSILSAMMKCKYQKVYEQRLEFQGAATLKDWNVHMFSL